MEKIMPGHLVGWESVRDMEELEQDYYGEFTDAGMSQKRNIITSKEYDYLCELLSGECKSPSD